MNAIGGKNLVVGDRMRWLPDGSEGTVNEVTSDTVEILWDDEQWSLLYFSDSRTRWDNVEHVGHKSPKCSHPTIWPDGTCTACGVLATTVPGLSDSHKVVPRKQRVQ